MTIKTPLADAFVAAIRAAFPGQPLHVRIVYNGAGDDGWFDDFHVHFTPRDHDYENISGWYARHITSGEYKPYGDEDIQRIQVKKAQARIISDVLDKHDINEIYRELGEILCRRHPGWEINDGGSGAFVFYPDGTRRHEHTTNVMETIDEEQPF
jgi:hypothetical protein